MKKFITFSVIVALAAAGVAFSAFAKGTETAPGLAIADLPEQAGVYSVPGNSNLKLRVIVYHGKPTEKPGRPTPTPSEVCGLADPGSGEITPVDPLDPWYLTSDWEYRLNISSAPGSISAAEVVKLAANAFGAWNALDGVPNINAANTTTKNGAQLDGQNIVAWGRTSSSALATTYIWYYTNVTPHPVAEIDMIMNQKFSWEWSDPDTWASKAGYVPGTTCAYQGVYDAQDIMTHEVGHWVGLDDTYTGVYANNTMYGYGAKTETKKDSLTTGDILGVQAIYSR